MIPAQVDPSRLHVLRTLDDAVRLRAALTDGVRLTIVGSGFVGAEVAATAAARGAEVTVLEAEPIPFGRTLGEQVGGWLVERWHEAGVTVRTGSAVHTIEQGVEAPVSITLADGSSVLSDHVLVAIGTVADDALFHEAHPGLGTIGRGIPVDEDGRSQVDGVFAVGDVALVGAGASARRVEHWTDAAAGAIRLARLLARQPLGTRPVPYAWSDQFGLRVQVAGLIAADLEAVVDDASPRSLLVRYLDPNGRVRGVAGVGHAATIARYRGELTA
jgi:NADPH-dependent 2,4-dienoyl-CoA reductase/sulfur reductase-like enzyme